jgi:hypothetical protein
MTSEPAADILQPVQVLNHTAAFYFELFSSEQNKNRNGEITTP